MMAGQSATSIQHVWAHQSLFEPLANTLTERVARLRAGDPMDESVSLPPLIHPHALQRIAQWVDDALQRGARALTGATAEPPFYLPTVLTDVPPRQPAATLKRCSVPSSSCTPTRRPTSCCVS
jgi:acyl-CoA reductase-like NAD-dependent aldehyde dehydrogenase